MRLPLYTAVGLLMGMLFVTGCDNAPGAIALDREPPRVSNLTYAPEQVVVADPDAETVEVPLQLVADVEPGDAPIERVTFSILASTAGLGATGPLDSLGAPAYGLNALFELPADPDQYTIRVFATDADSLQSNVALGQVRIVSDTTATP